MPAEADARRGHGLGILVAAGIIHALEALAPMRSAFVTEPTGLLGTALVRRLLEEGVEVTALRRDASPTSALVLKASRA